MELKLSNVDMNTVCFAATDLASIDISNFIKSGQLELRAPGIAVDRVEPTLAQPLLSILLIASYCKPSFCRKAKPALQAIMSSKSPSGSIPFKFHGLSVAETSSDPPKGAVTASGPAHYIVPGLRDKSAPDRVLAMIVLRYTFRTCADAVSVQQACHALSKGTLCTCMYT